MKNILSISLISFVVLCSFSSCKKCAHCDNKDGTKTSQFCGTTGVSTNDVYSVQKTKCENAGGTWTIE